MVMSALYQTQTSHGCTRFGESTVRPTLGVEARWRALPFTMSATSHHDDFILSCIKSGAVYVDPDTGWMYGPRRLGRLTQLSGPASRKRYYVASLRRPDGSYLKVRQHRVVMIAIHGLPPNPNMHVNHKDGDGLNNHPSNLEWATASENTRHAISMGLVGPSYNRKLNETNVHAVVADRASGMTWKMLGKKYGIAASALRVAFSPSGYGTKLLTTAPDPVALATALDANWRKA